MSQRDFEESSWDEEMPSIRKYLNTQITDQEMIMRKRPLGQAFGAALVAITLASGCTDTTGSTTQANASPSTTWTTISKETMVASTKASASDLRAANAHVKDVSTEDDTAGSWDAASATTIALADSGSTVSGPGTSGVKVTGSTVTIKAGGTYLLSGNLSDGQLVVDADGATVRVILNNASINNNDNPAVNIENVEDLILVLAKDSKNSISDGGTYANTSADAPSAALFASDDLTITGSGSLQVSGSYKDAISTKNGLVITGNPTILAKAADDGIRGKDYVVVESGTLRVEAGGDGLKSSEDNDQTKGFVSLGRAAVEVTSGDDGIQATTDITVEGTELLITAGGGATNGVAENPGGPGSATTSSSAQSDSPKGMVAGVAMSVDSGTLRVDAADEGLQAAAININGGVVNVLSGDDGVNASSSSYLIEGYENADSEADDGSIYSQAGGTVTINSRFGDGLDSNGSAHVTGGLTVIEGVPADAENTVDVNGSRTLFGVTVSLKATKGSQVTITQDGEPERSFAATTDTNSLTVVGLSEGNVCKVSTGSTSVSATSGSVADVGGPGGGMGGRRHR